MDAGRWAKIFAPFDALEGFDEAVQAKEVLYSVKTELSEYEQEKLDRKIAALSGLTQTSRSARKNQVMVSVTRFCPCMDLNHPAYGTKGKYKSVHGMALGVKGDGLSIRTETGDVRIPLSDIKEIDCGLFEEEY